MLCSGSFYDPAQKPSSNNKLHTTQKIELMDSLGSHAGYKRRVDRTAERALDGSFLLRLERMQVRSTTFTRKIGIALELGVPMIQSRPALNAIPMSHPVRPQKYGARLFIRRTASVHPRPNGQRSAVRLRNHVGIVSVYE